MSIGGLFSPEYLEAPWSLAKVLDLLRHLWIPVIIVGTGHTAKFIRIIRGNLLDELKKPVCDCRTGQRSFETRLILKYPVRVAINPLVSTIGWTLPELISGIAITAVVLNLPTSGPLLLSALLEPGYAACRQFHHDPELSHCGGNASTPTFCWHGWIPEFVSGHVRGYEPGSKEAGKVPQCLHKAIGLVAIQET